jgi:hypothetical protein
MPTQIISPIFIAHSPTLFICFPFLLNVQDFVVTAKLGAVSPRNAASVVLLRPDDAIDASSVPENLAEGFADVDFPPRRP